MRVLKYIRDMETVKVIPDSSGDLWHIERVILPGDLIASRSWRRFKTSEGENGEKREVFVQLEAERMEFSEHANRLRVTGKIVAGGPAELIQLGSYHTIDVEPGITVEIRKPKGWKKFEVDRLREAEKAGKAKVKLGVVAMDEKSATFAAVKEYGVSFDFTIDSSASKREGNYEKKQLEFFGEITKALSNSKAGKIVIAGPGFAKDSLKKFIADRDQELLKKLVFENASTAEESGVYELMKRGVLEKVAGEERIEKEFALMEEFTKQVSKDSGLAAYGEPEVRKAMEYGAIGKLMISDELLRKEDRIRLFAEVAERAGCEIIIFGSESPAGQQLAGFSGIAALLRFKIR